LFASYGSTLYVFPSSTDLYPSATKLAVGFSDLLFAGSYAVNVPPVTTIVATLLS